MKQILLATDGSEGALAAAQLLARLPLPPDCRVTLLTVLPEDQDGNAEAAFAPILYVLGHTAASVQNQIRRGSAAEEILRAAEAEPTDLVVVGSRGLSGLTRFFLGSVAERLARHAPCPVLLGRPLVNDLRQVVVGIDGSESAVQAVDWLRQFPLPDDCQFHLVTMMPCLKGLSVSRKLQWTEQYEALYREEYEEARQHLETVAASFLVAGRQGVAALREGDPANGLLQYADEQQADLIVVGSRGVGGIERFLLGSTSEQVLLHNQASTLIVR